MFNCAHNCFDLSSPIAHKQTQTHTHAHTHTHARIHATKHPLIPTLVLTLSQSPLSFFFAAASHTQLQFWSLTTNTTYRFTLTLRIFFCPPILSIFTFSNHCSLKQSNCLHHILLNLKAFTFKITT